MPKWIRRKAYDNSLYTHIGNYGKHSFGVRLYVGSSYLQFYRTYKADGVDSYGFIFHNYLLGETYCGGMKPTIMEEINERYSVTKNKFKLSINHGNCYKWYDYNETVKILKIRTLNLIRDKLEKFICNTQNEENDRCRCYSVMFDEMIKKVSKAVEKHIGRRLRQYMIYERTLYV